jgi:dTDP-4-dehydrorhamnose 3,5-epimerase
VTLQFLETPLPGVRIVAPDLFGDARGFFLETWQRDRYRQGGIDVDFVQDNHSRSQQGVIRGLHYQLAHAQAKLIYVVRGAVFDVAVDIRRGSPYFSRWTGHLLSEENRRQLFVPRGFAHGFAVLSDLADVTYRCSDYYTPGDEYGIAWNDPDLGIDWGLSDPVVSAKDMKNPCLKDVPAHLLPGS